MGPPARLTFGRKTLNRRTWELRAALVFFAPPWRRLWTLLWRFLWWLLLRLCGLRKLLRWLVSGPGLIRWPGLVPLLLINKLWLISRPRLIYRSGVFDRSRSRLVSGPRLISELCLVPRPGLVDRLGVIPGPWAVSGRWRVVELAIRWWPVKTLWPIKTLRGKGRRGLCVPLRLSTPLPIVLSGLLIGCVVLAVGCVVVLRVVIVLVLSVSPRFVVVLLSPLLFVHIFQPPLFIKTLRRAVGITFCIGVLKESILLFACHLFVMPTMGASRMLGSACSILIRI